MWKKTVGRANSPHTVTFIMDKRDNSSTLHTVNFGCVVVSFSGLVLMCDFTSTEELTVTTLSILHSAMLLLLPCNICKLLENSAVTSTELLPILAAAQSSALN